MIKWIKENWDVLTLFIVFDCYVLYIVVEPFLP